MQVLCVLHIRSLASIGVIDDNNKANNYTVMIHLLINSVANVILSAKKNKFFMFFLV